MRRRFTYRDHSSDKEYIIQVERIGTTDTWNVVGYWGRRGSPNQSQIKNKTPLSMSAAMMKVEELCAERRAKGYSEDRSVNDSGSNDTRLTRSTPAKNDTGSTDTRARRTVAPVTGVANRVPPMLLTPIDRVEALAKIADDKYLSQPKWDGVRAALHKEGEKVFAVSRTSKPLALSEALVAAAKKSPRDFVLDGELVGSVYICFDALFDNTLDLRNETCEFRIHQAASLFTAAPEVLCLSQTAYTKEEKQVLFDSAFAGGGEGVVFKLKSAGYSSGRSRIALKHKFWSAASVIVGGNKKADTHSFGMYLADSTYLGNCTMAQRKPLPAMGSIVEVKFLYRNSETGGLIQPNFLRMRDDIEDYECNAEQLFVKDTERSEEET